jgi:uncharacterized protein YutE (UPF0331/DUF86 family)
MDTRLLNHLETTRTYIEKTKRLHNPDKQEFIADEKTYLAISMTVFTIINEVIEIGELLIDKESLKIPLSYREIFITLRDTNIISTDIATTLESYIKYRNMIAHQYATFDREKIFEVAENTAVFEQFLQEILHYYQLKEST